MKVCGFIYIHYFMKMKGRDPCREADMTWMGIKSYNMTQRAKLAISKSSDAVDAILY